MVKKTVTSTKAKEPKEGKARINSIVENRICREVASGRMLAEVCEDKGMRSVHDITKHAAKNPAFKLALSFAWVSCFNIKMREYDDLSKMLLKTKSKDKFEIERVKIRMKSLEFQIKVSSQMLTDHFRQAVEVKHSGTIKQAMQIVNFSQADVQSELDKAKKLLETKLTKH